MTAKTYAFQEAIRGSLILMHQVNSVVLYVIAFAFVGADILKWHVLLIVCVVMALFGYCVYAVLLSLDRRRNQATSAGFEGKFEGLAIRALPLKGSYDFSSQDVQDVDALRRVWIRIESGFQDADGDDQYGYDLRVGYAHVRDQHSVCGLRSGRRYVSSLSFSF